MGRILAACGNDCSACPRFVLPPYEKTETELRQTAELWMKIGYREHVVPANVLSLLRGLFVIVPAAVVLAVLFHVTGVWLAFPVTEGLCAVGSVACILHFRQKDKDAEW